MMMRGGIHVYNIMLFASLFALVYSAGAYYAFRISPRSITGKMATFYKDNILIIGSANLLIFFVTHNSVDYTIVYDVALIVFLTYLFIRLLPRKIALYVADCSAICFPICAILSIALGV